jgi:twitching motility two-component system response regulator PilH
MPKKVMVVDDESDIQLYLMAALEDEGYQVCSPGAGIPIEIAIETEKPDLVLLDIMMPKRSGISVYKRLRTSEAFRDIPVVLMSGMIAAKDFLPTEFRVLVQDDSVPLPDGFVEKPVRIPVLLEVVSRILSR